MRITWIGNHEEGIRAFKETAMSGMINGFITLSTEMFKKRSAGTREYIDICKKNNIPLFYVKTIKEDEAFEIISELRPDLLVVIGWSEILPERLLEIPIIGTVGTHAALLPHNRGSAPINWALIHGEKKTGNTLMWLTKEVDAGRIIDQIEFPITIFDTCKTLYDLVAETNATMIGRLIDTLQKGKDISAPLENITDEPVLLRRRPSDGLINWQQDSLTIYNFIRALTKPYPGAFTFLNGRKYILWKAAVLPFKSTREPGTILEYGYGFEHGNTGLCIAANDGVLYITEIEDEAGIQYADKALYDLNLEGAFANE